MKQMPEQNDKKKLNHIIFTNQIRSNDVETLQDFTRQVERKWWHLTQNSSSARGNVLHK